MVDSSTFLDNHCFISKMITKKRNSMCLTEYIKKRNFGITPEPYFGKASMENPIFVVQEHYASHLHYDFRLEIDGVLKSWAVPKGPSMDSADKRLAILVEDHPLDYAHFEGVIPQGEYGAGTVEIWDNGYWVLDDSVNSPNQALQSGAFKFILYGEKLKGEFVLVEMKNSRVKNGWLLIKEKDNEKN